MNIQSNYVLGKNIKKHPQDTFTHKPRTVTVTDFSSLLNLTEVYGIHLHT
jgi:hypothetical protein